MALLRTVPLSILPYQFKKNKLFLILGAGITILIMPFVLVQVWRAWRLSGEKIKQGPLIDTLK